MICPSRRAFAERVSRLRQEPEHADSRRSTDVYLAVRDRWDDELVTGPEVIACSSLIAVIEFDGQIRSVVGVQNRGGGILGGPCNAVASPVRADTRRRAWVSE